MTLVTTALWRVDRGAPSSNKATMRCIKDDGDCEELLRADALQAIDKACEEDEGVMKQRDAAATKLQAVSRGRQKRAELKVERERKAAVVIQNAQRCKVAKAKVQSERERVASAKKIQRLQRKRMAGKKKKIQRMTKKQKQDAKKAKAKRKADREKKRQEKALRKKQRKERLAKKAQEEKEKARQDRIHEMEEAAKARQKRYQDSLAQGHSATPFNPQDHYAFAKALEVCPQSKQYSLERTILFAYKASSYGEQCTIAGHVLKEDSLGTLRRSAKYFQEDGTSIRSSPDAEDRSMAVAAFTDAAEKHKTISTAKPYLDGLDYVSGLEQLAKLYLLALSQAEPRAVRAVVRNFKRNRKADGDNHQQPQVAAANFQKEGSKKGSAVSPAPCHAKFASRYATFLASLRLSNPIAKNACHIFIAKSEQPKPFLRSWNLIQRRSLRRHACSAWKMLPMQSIELQLHPMLPNGKR